MLDAHGFNPQTIELSRPQKPGKELFKPPVEAVREQREKTEAAQSERAVSWYTVESKDGELTLSAVPNTTQVDVTSVLIHPEELSAPKGLNIFGCKIDLSAKLEELADKYVKNYALTKSHNLMVARFAQLKVGGLGYLLSILGMSTEELRKLQKKALGQAQAQNRVLFEENEYNGELLAIVGGGGRKLANSQQKIIGEIRKQLVAQANNLGLGDYYSKQRTLQIQIEQCQKIMLKFQEEKNNLEYQLAYGGVN